MAELPATTQDIEAARAPALAAVTTNDEEDRRMTTPERSRQQRLDALRHANDVRTYRARLKKDMKAGRRSIDSLLRHPPAEIATMKVIDLMLHVPKYGRVKVTQALKVCAISPSKTIAGMTDRQRYELLREIRTRDAERFARTPDREHTRIAA